jgi:hypothetical protein
MRKNNVEGGRSHFTIWCMLSACWIPKATNTHSGWIPKATNTHSEYVIPIVFPLQQWLHEGASKLRYTYIGCAVVNSLHVPNTIYSRFSESRRFEALFSPSRCAADKVVSMMSKEFCCNTYICVYMCLSGIIVPSFSRLVFVFLCTANLITCFNVPKQ